MSNFRDIFFWVDGRVEEGRGRVEEEKRRKKMRDLTNQGREGREEKERKAGDIVT